MINSMIKPQFANNEIYHVYNRGVEKRNIFLKDRDYRRFLDGVAIFNTSLPARLDQHERVEMKTEENKNKNPLVEVLSFCLMPNHFHLMLRQTQEGGISIFMQKLCTGYSMYFNKINNRVGSLFQNKFRAVRVATDQHLFCLPHYIHLNPAEILNLPLNKKSNAIKVIDRLVEYPWSSLSDFIGLKRYSHIVSNTFIKQFFKTPLIYKKNLAEWIKDMKLTSVEEVAIDLPIPRSDLT